MVLLFSFRFCTLARVVLRSLVRRPRVTRGFGLGGYKMGRLAGERSSKELLGLRITRGSSQRSAMGPCAEVCCRQLEAKFERLNVLPASHAVYDETASPQLGDGQQKVSTSRPGRHSTSSDEPPHRLPTHRTSSKHSTAKASTGWNVSRVFFFRRQHHVQRRSSKS